MKKKIFVLIVLFLSMIFFVGWGKRKIELMDEKKLIDLSKAIKYVEPGGDIDENDGGSESDESIEQSETETDTQEAETDITDTEEQTIIITIYGEVVLYNGQEVDTIDQIEEYIRRDYKENMHVVLKDDWAESHQFKKVLRMLEKLHEEVDVTYSIE